MSLVLLQAVTVREALAYILQHHLLSVSNSCSMLEAACEASIPSLAAIALRLIQGNFMQVLQCHGGTFGGLSRGTLMLVLCSDNLQVICLAAAAIAAFNVACYAFVMHTFVMHLLWEGECIDRLEVIQLHLQTVC